MVNKKKNKTCDPAARRSCVVCNKKIPHLMLSLYTCKCGKIVCSEHKSESLHDCDFDWRSRGKDILKSKLMNGVDTKQIAKI